MKERLKNLWAKYKPILTPAVEVTALVGLGFALGYTGGHGVGYDEGRLAAYEDETVDILKELIRKNETLKF